MEKILSRFGLLIAFVIIYGSSYLLDSMFSFNQEETFIFLIWIVIIFLSLFIYISVITKNCKKCKLLFILWMLVMFGVVSALSWVAMKIFNVDYKVAFILITLGVAIKDVFYIKKDENKNEKKKEEKVEEENDNNYNNNYNNNLRRRRR